TLGHAIHANAGLSLRHAPEPWDRPIADTGYIASPCLIGVVKASRYVEHVLHAHPVHIGNNCLFLIEVLSIIPFRSLVNDFEVIRPAEPGFVPARADSEIANGRGTIRAGMPGMEHAPTALPGRVL